jgi:hypothetical protein
VDVLRRFWYVCFGCELHQEKVGTLPCHYDNFWGSWNLRVVMAIQFKDLFVRYNLLVKVIIYVKDENANLNTLTMTLINIVSFVLYFYHNPTLLVVMGMPCPSVVSMLLMTWKCLVA